MIPSKATIEKPGAFKSLGLLAQWSVAKKKSRNYVEKLPRTTWRNDYILTLLQL